MALLIKSLKNRWLIEDSNVAVVIVDPPDAPITKALAELFNMIIGDVEDCGLFPGSM